MGKVLDYVFLLYFVTHIPITVLIDAQCLLPKQLYPALLQDVMKWYSVSFKDPYVLHPPAWFNSFIVCELLFQLPFFFFATYAFWKGVENCRWVRIPCLVYSSHVATTVIAIIYHTLVNDFSQCTKGSSGCSPGPVSLHERLSLTAIYAPYLAIPLLLMLRMFELAPDQSNYASNQSKQKTR